MSTSCGNVVQMTTVHKRERTVLRIYIENMRDYLPHFFGIIISILVMQGAQLAAPLYLRSFINTLAIGEPSPEAVRALLTILGIVVFVWLVDWTAHRVQYYLGMRLQTKVMASLLQSTFKYLLGHSHNFFISQFAGSLTHRISKFARAYELIFDGVVGNILPALLFICGAIVILFIRNHTLGILLFGWAVCYLVFQIYVARLRQPSRVARAEADSRVVGNLADAISNQSTVTLFSGAQAETKRFRETVDVWREALVKTWLADAWIWAGIGLFMIGIQTALLYVGVRLWQQGLFTVGDFVLVQAYLLTAFERMEKMNRDLRRMGDAYSDAKEMAEILNTPHEVRDVSGAKPLAVKTGVVTFENVKFFFSEQKSVFTNFNCTIKGGEKVAFVGPSGAGKSTLTKLLLRLFDVKNGAVRVDGQNIVEVTQASLRDAIGVVPQEPILFHRTLMENIRYGRRDASDAEVIEASKKAFCHEFISSLSLGYGTYVGERGVKLSGGERQRVAIARAILKNAPILMLDEATSSLDSTSELLIQDALANLMEGKTVIVIAHRLSTIMKMDRIITIKEGDIVEEGTHQELLGKGGLYATLWSHQAGGFLQDEEV